MTSFCLVLETEEPRQQATHRKCNSQPPGNVAPRLRFQSRNGTGKVNCGLSSLHEINQTESQRREKSCFLFDPSLPVCLSSLTAANLGISSRCDRFTKNLLCVKRAFLTRQQKSIGTFGERVPGLLDRPP